MSTNETISPEEVSRRAAVVARREKATALATAHAEYLALRARKDAALNAALSGTKGDERKAKRAKLLRNALPHKGEAFVERVTLSRAMVPMIGADGLPVMVRSTGNAFNVAHTLEGYRAGGRVTISREGRVGTNALESDAATGAMSRSAKRKAHAASLAIAAANGKEGDAAKLARLAAREKLAGTGLTDEVTVTLTFTPLPATGAYVVSAPLVDASGEAWLVSGRVTLTDWTMGDVDAF